MDTWPGLTGEGRKVCGADMTEESHEVEATHDNESSEVRPDEHVTYEEMMLWREFGSALRGESRHIIRIIDPILKWMNWPNRYMQWTGSLPGSPELVAGDEIWRERYSSNVEIRIADAGMSASARANIRDRLIALTVASYDANEQDIAKVLTNALNAVLPMTGPSNPPTSVIAMTVTVKLTDDKKRACVIFDNESAQVTLGDARTYIRAFRAMSNAMMRKV